MTAATGTRNGRPWSERQTGYARFDQVCAESPSLAATMTTAIGQWWGGLISEWDIRRRLKLRCSRGARLLGGHGAHRGGTLRSRSSHRLR